MDWDGDGDVDEDDAMIYLYQAYDCENPLGGDCEEYVTVVFDCLCGDNETVVFWEEVDELNCQISEMCECIPLNNGWDWNDVDWVDSDWSDFDWETVWSDYDLGNVVDWDNIPWGDITDLNIFPDDLITYIQNIIALGQGFNWDDFIEMQVGEEDCCINPEWIDPMAMCSFLYDPVIGCDGLEYANSCVAEAAGITSYSDNFGNETILEWDCNQAGDDCVDDPEGILAQYGLSCSELLTFDCDTDLSSISPLVPFGISVYEICPQSCDECGDDGNQFIGYWYSDDVDGETEYLNINETEIIIFEFDDIENCFFEYSTEYSYLGEGVFSVVTPDFEVFDINLNILENGQLQVTLPDAVIFEYYSVNEIPNDLLCDDEGDCIAELIPDCVFMAVVDPVCGCDGVTYSNSGEAACNNIFDFTMGECEVTVDCIDDPEDMLTQYGYSCGELSILGCDADLSDFIPGIGFGISVYEICPESCTDCGEGTAGCTDFEACNYNPDAITDDGSCDYGFECLVSPCSTTPSPFPGANCVDDYCEGCCAIWTWTNEGGYDFYFNSCNDYIEGCMDEAAINYNPTATEDDGSCIYENSNLDETSILDFNLYPNPNNGSFNIVLNNDQGEFNIVVFNILGKVVYTQLVHNYVKNSIKTIDIGFKKGTYIVNLQTNSSFIKIPMLIE